MTGRFRRSVLLVLVNIAVLVFLLSLFEGCSSLLLFGRDFSSKAPMGERLHTRYDAELGWVNLPGLSLPDLYGPEIPLHTNARGFRGREEIDARAPTGVRRIICSGDSFTLGFGVGDEQTWCHRLGASAPHLQSVNMGQGGYGSGQSFLWYQRDARDVEHHVLIFAFIWDDFRRMLTTDFLGYGKPRFAVAGPELAAENVPVPRSAYYAPWLTRNIGQIMQLRGVQLTMRVAARLGLSGPEARGNPAGYFSWSSEEAERVLELLFRDLKQLSEERSSQLVLVFLPTMVDYRDDTALAWSAFVQQQATRLEIPFIDLVKEIRARRPMVVQGLYIQPGEVDFAQAEGHYNARGNRLVAKILGAELAKLPRVVEALSPITPDP